LKKSGKKQEDYSPTFVGFFVYKNTATIFST